MCDKRKMKREASTHKKGKRFYYSRDSYKPAAAVEEEEEEEESRPAGKIDAIRSDLGLEQELVMYV